MRLTQDGPRTAERDSGASRRALLAAAAGGAGLFAVPRIGRLVRLGDAVASPSPAQDAKILQLVARLEHTQVAFYEQALAHGSLRGELHRFAVTVLAHERAHLTAVERALAGKAAAKPHFSFGVKTKSALSFMQASAELEDIAVAAYNGQAANLTKPTLAAAAEIVSVEARHAAWMRAIAGQVAAPDPVDKPLSAAEVVHALERFGVKA